MKQLINNLRSRLSLTKGTKLSVSENPWAGLSSYEDPAKTTNPLKFCGRDAESAELFRLIDNNIVVTLYGKSGIGKTSLLNAGVFPLLRYSNYSPISIRLGISDSVDSYADYIINTINEGIKQAFGDTAIKAIDNGLIPVETDINSDKYLWSYFARHQFCNDKEEVIFPVIVLDQFEENIRLNPDLSARILKQIAYLSDNQNEIRDIVINNDNNEVYRYDNNFRFVVSVREDDLYRLEDLLDLNFLSSLKGIRYRLHNLSEDSAKEVIQMVGANCIDQSIIDTISANIIDASKDKKDRLIQTNVLSLICARLYDRVSRHGVAFIRLSDVDSYLSENPFDDYYTEAVKHLSEGEKRFIESEFVSSDGRRVMIKESDVKISSKSLESLRNGPLRILHDIHNDSGEEPYVELIHDGLCSIALKHRAQRLEKKNKTILSLCLFILLVVGLWMLNTSIVNDIAQLFLDVIGKSGSEHSISHYIHILTLSQLLTIIIAPLSISSIVYDWKKKRVIALILLALYFLPCIYYRDAFKHVMSACQLIYTNFKDSPFNTFSGLSNHSYVFMAYTLIIGTLCAMSFRERAWRGRKVDFRQLYWNLPIGLYFLAIAFFLYYKSLFNTGSFCIESSDSAWGILVIPMLTLFTFGFTFSTLRHKLSFIAYGIILITYTICVCMSIYYPCSILGGLILVALVILLLCYLSDNILESISKAFANALILGVVIIMNLGYYPVNVKVDNITKIYPWQVVEFKHNGNVGIVNAISGDTILEPKFLPDTAFVYYKIIPQNSYIDIDTLLIQSNRPFPLKLENTKDSLKISLMCSPIFELAIRQWTKSGSTDSISKQAAKLFIKLRSDIIDFCINGNPKILNDNVEGIVSYERNCQSVLSQSLSQLSLSDSSYIREADVVRFLKELSRALYMNILKEAIVLGNYSYFIDSFIMFYMPLNLSDFMTATNFGSYTTFNLHLDETPILSFNYTDLNGCWSNLWSYMVSGLCQLDMKLHLKPYYDYLKQKARECTRNIENLQKLDSSMANLLKSGKILNSDFQNVIERLKFEETNDINFSQILEVLSSSNSYEKSVKTWILSNKAILNDVNESFQNRDLKKLDSKFEKLFKDIIQSAYQIKGSNQYNAYNGLLSTICQRLYIIGVFRSYNMTEFTDNLNDFGIVDPLFETYKDSALKSAAIIQKADSIQMIYNLYEKKIKSYTAGHLPH
jgi:hypothetical protein